MNPDGVKNQIEGNVIQAMSRTLLEEVRFDATSVTSIDWSSYPIVRFRLRALPFTAERVKQALA